MTKVAIIPEIPAGFRAIAGPLHSVGSTAGQALDALTEQLDENQKGTLIIVQHFRPDPFFTAEQQERLADLMQRWRNSRDGKGAFSPDEQVELDALMDAEVKASGERAAAMLRELGR